MVQDYVYIPLGGNRRGEVRTYVQHVPDDARSRACGTGPTWTFVIWGAVHAAGPRAHAALERTAFYRDRVPTLVKQLLTFSCS